MNVKFKILWYEDNAEWYDTERKRICDILKEYNLEGEFLRKEYNSGNVPDDILNNDWDLIFMDYKLQKTDNGQVADTGDEIAKKIRQGDITADIIFYSATMEELIESLRAKNELIEGCFFSKRDHDECTNKARIVIKKIVHRSEDAIGLRGLVLEHSADFETRIAELLKRMWSMLDDKQKSNVFEEVTNIINCWVTQTNTLTKEYESTLSFNKMLKNSSYLPIDKRLLLFDKMSGFIGKSNEVQEFYHNKIGKFRNKVSHLSVMDKQIKIDGKEIEINSDLFLLIRQNINNVDDKLKEIESSL